MASRYLSSGPSVSLLLYLSTAQDPPRRWAHRASLVWAAAFWDLREQGCLELVRTTGALPFGTRVEARPLEQVAGRGLEGAIMEAPWARLSQWRCIGWQGR